MYETEKYNVTIPAIYELLYTFSFISERLEHEKSQDNFVVSHICHMCKSVLCSLLCFLKLYAEDLNF
jgi:hypothetical protein